MVLLERIADMLNGRNGEFLRWNQDAVAEVRLRCGRELRLSMLDGSEIVGEKLDTTVFQRIINFLMDNSVYSRENELKQGYFTTADGFRVGVCGKVNANDSGINCLANIGSVCIRVPREVPGCSLEIVAFAQETARYSILIVSPPGLGKTTILRDYIRVLSDGGMNVCLADERREIACCMEGVPRLQVGSRTDVMDGCPKWLGLSMMIRACAPELIAVDEIGSSEDANALFEAAKSGVAVAATAHGSSMKDVLMRKYVASLINSHVFDWCVLLGPKRGQTREIFPLYLGMDGKVLDVQGNIAGSNTAGLYMRGEDVFKCTQEEMRNFR